MRHSRLRSLERSLDRSRLGSAGTLIAYNAAGEIVAWSPTGGANIYLPSNGRLDYPPLDELPPAGSVAEFNDWYHDTRGAQTQIADR